MPNRLDAWEFALYARSRWKSVLACCVAAASLAAAASLLLPKRYTAIASIMVEPPAGMDPRAATTLSPVYLESLRTYERLVSSDTLFRQALDDLHIRARYSNRSIESLKRSVLQVSKPANTRIIEIAVTLDDPKGAQALAQYIAEHTAALNHALGERSAAETMQQARTLFEVAQARLRRAQDASDRFTASQSNGISLSDIDSTGQLKFEVNRDLEKSRAQFAELLSEPGKSDSTGRQIVATRARIAELETQARRLQESLSEKGKLLDRQQHRRDLLDAELTSARTEFDTLKTSLSEIQSSAAFRGERLEVFDPGIVPQRPSSPNLPLNVMVALLFSLLASTAWLAVRFGIHRMNTAHAETPLAVAFTPRGDKRAAG
jgi:uncharacterized protein involved in exopolysaccharide biosynthesis